jgi:hypothetical protein
MRPQRRWTGRSGAWPLFDKFSISDGTGPAHLAQLTAKLTPEALEAPWRAATGSPLPAPVRDQVTSQNPPTRQGVPAVDDVAASAARALQSESGDQLAGDVEATPRP